MLNFPILCAAIFIILCIIIFLWTFFLLLSRFMQSYLHSSELALLKFIIGLFLFFSRSLAFICYALKEAKKQRFIQGKKKGYSMYCNLRPILSLPFYTTIFSPIVWFHRADTNYKLLDSSLPCVAPKMTWKEGYMEFWRLFLLGF